jgi:hypothetical protein
MTSRTSGKRRAALAAILLAGTGAYFAVAAEGDADKRWPIHDRNRPQPKVVDPGMNSTQDQVGKAPSDAIVLFDGKDLSQWTNDTWKVDEGTMLVGRGSTQTKESFGDCQLHIEWRTPTPPKGKDQGRGNSGVFLMNTIEVQVLDSYENETYPDGQAAAVYGQYAPQVNASRPPGQWQSYDIIFRRARYDEAGKLQKPATLTVLHNGVLVQDHVEVFGPTSYPPVADYKRGPDAAPIQIQDHGDPMRFRNIWIRPLEKLEIDARPSALKK